MTKMALRMFKGGIIARGFGHLVSSAIVLTVVTPGSDPTLEPELVEGLARLGLPEENVIRVPYEPSFATGERIVYDRLLPSTIELTPMSPPKSRMLSLPACTAALPSTPTRTPPPSRSNASGSYSTYSPTRTGRAVRRPIRGVRAGTPAEPPAPSVLAR